MGHAAVIYRILRALSFMASCEEPPMERLSPESLGCTREVRDSMLVALAKAGHVDGVECRTWSDDVQTVTLAHPSITLSGITYLNGDPAMLAESRRARGIVREFGEE